MQPPQHRGLLSEMRSRGTAKVLEPVFTRSNNKRTPYAQKNCRKEVRHCRYHNEGAHVGNEEDVCGGPTHYSESVSIFWRIINGFVLRYLMNAGVFHVTSVLRVLPRPKRFIAICRSEPATLGTMRSKWEVRLTSFAQTLVGLRKG